MANFITVNNWTNEVVTTIENVDAQEIFAGAEYEWAMGEIECAWYTLYLIDDNASYSVAVFDDGNWYEPDGYTPLAW